MKRYITKIALAAVLVVSMMLLTACPKPGSGGSGGETTSNSDDQALAVAVVAGKRMCNNEISVSAEEVSDAVYDSCYSFGYVSFARVDGSPEQYIKHNIPEPDVEGLSEAKLKSIAEGYRDEIFAEYMKDGDAKYPEADTLEAIRMEAATLKETGDNTDKYLVVIDSGLSTTGYLNFKNGLFEADTNDIIAELDRKQAIPDFTGINITWLYCGEVAAPQEKLSEVQKNKVKEIYGAIFDAGNAASYVFSEDIPTATPYTELPEVSIIDAEERQIEVTPVKTIVLDASHVSFIGDEANFIDPVKAKEEIQKVSDMLKANPENNVYVAGSTAGMDGDSKWCKELSEARAKAVVEVMKEFGVSGDRLIPVGLGSNAPWHVPDVDESGNWIEDKAQQNRCVYIVDVNDPDYGAALSSF